jgi:hypothetical protein
MGKKKIHPFKQAELSVLSIQILVTEDHEKGLT